MARKIIQTDQAPAAIGPYAQAVRAGDLVFVSGQIPLDPVTMDIVDGGIEEQARRVFENLRALCLASDGGLEDVCKMTIYLTDLSHFATVNAIMAEYFEGSTPARAAIGVNELPRSALVEIEAILSLADRD